jgi:hypothetical protein
MITGCRSLATYYGFAGALWPFVWNRTSLPISRRDTRQPEAAVLRGLMARSTASKAWRSAPLKTPEKQIRSRAWGWLGLFAASTRARRAARTSPPAGAMPGLGHAQRAEHAHLPQQTRFNTKRHRLFAGRLPSQPMPDWYLGGALRRILVHRLFEYSAIA